MKYIVTGDEMKEYDNNTIEHIGIPGLTLMEYAAMAVCRHILQLDMPEKRIFILCGIGNNGGDGLALARLLCLKGIRVDVCIMGDCRKGTDSFQVQLLKIDKTHVRFLDWQELLTYSEDSYNIIVDALFGVGLSREIAGDYQTVIKKCNAFNGVKIAVDIPSGICANTGKVLGCAFRADKTITFAFGKVGLYLYPGASYAGEIIVEDIGITEHAFEEHPPRFFTYRGNPLEYLPQRRPDGNKGTFGKVLVIAGFETMIGAAILCSRAALQMGAGMVKVICEPENRGILQGAIPEVLYSNPKQLLEGLGWADVLVMGPGLGKSEAVRELLQKVLEEGALPLVLDADALNLISENAKLQELLINYKMPKVLTPHVGELARLAATNIKDTKDALINIAKSLSKEYHSLVVAKDARTLVVGKEPPYYLNTTGNNGMATAGSGDVLAGMIGALIGQGMEAYEAACAGVYLHGLAGDSACDIYTEFGVTASRLIENIRKF